MVKTSAVHLFARGDIVAAVQHRIVMRNQFAERGFIQLRVDRLQRAVRIERRQLLTGRGDFCHADARIAVQNLALQITQADAIKIQQRQMTDAGGGKIGRGSTA